MTTLFAAAIVPGLLLALLFTSYAMIRCMINPSLGPPLPLSERPTSMREVWIEFFLGLVPPAALVLAALGSIVFGLATPTEGAACGAVGSLFSPPPMEGSRGATSRTHWSRRSRSRC